MNRGVHELSAETQILSQNTLVREISLMVAKKLMGGAQDQENMDLNRMVREQITQVSKTSVLQ